MQRCTSEHLTSAIIRPDSQEDVTRSARRVSVLHGPEMPDDKDPIAVPTAAQRQSYTAVASG
jgi:hypothetical protein